ncbi:hypothetical protein M407DRAFT_28328 [Tulasnella calospora MUT 4182]|uniref:Protein kinase domain-containing protein n=1 Tax=Tulasnella calospora MUT 4182 TaxID=1051891 RepID=A0A0C3KL08_9AGAM|nr:hypothetical protein M407DRAFT_28328 [Tulasnella calospora MUT 4182]
MRRLASKLLRIDGRTGEGSDRNAQQDAMAVSSQELIPKKPSARERLDGPGVSSFRIRSKEIKFTSTDSHGSGGKADVTQAKFKRADWSVKQLVAVKKLRSVETEEAHNEFIDEVEVMAGLSHNNIVQLIGFVEDLQKGIAWIVLSWEPNGNVSDFLAQADWQIPERVSLIQDAFEGVRYLHTHQPPICHGDLKSLNILVSSSCRAILTDFGSARAVIGPEDEVIDDEGDPQMRQGLTKKQLCPPIQVNPAGNHLTLTGPAWTLRWAPPEVVNGKRPGLSSDIWAAGWICWEVMTNKIPFPDINHEWGIKLAVIRGKVPPPHEEGQLVPIRALCNLMTDCWAMDPKARPGISQCCNELKWMPSDPPSTGAPSVRLLLQKGQIEFRRASYEEAASLFQQGLSLATSQDNQKWAAIALRFLGDTYRLQSKYSRAEESYNQAQEIFAHISDDKNQAMTMESMGRLLVLRSEFTQAEQVYTRAKEIYTRLDDERGQAISLSGLGRVCHLQSKYIQGEQLYSRAHELYARTGDDNGRANALLGLGDVYYGQSKYSQAEESYNGARELYARVGNDIGLGSALDGLGRVCWRQFKRTQAEELVSQAQEIYVRLGDDIGLSATLLSLGAIYCFEFEYTRAVEVYTRAQEISTSLGDDLGQGNALDGLATVYRLQSNNALAQELFNQAQDIYARLGNQEGLASTLSGLGEVYRSQSEYTQARESFSRAQEIYARIGNERGRSNALIGLGDVHRNQSKYAEAEESYIRALTICTRLGNDAIRANILWSMGHLRRSQENNEEAATFYIEAREICTRLGQIKKAEHVSSLLALMFPDEKSSMTSPDASVLPDIPSTNRS